MSDSTPDPIPFLLLGKIPGHIQACIEISRPEYEVILHRSSVPDACSVLPTLLSGGEIDGKTYPAIKFVVMGGGFSPAQFESVYTTVPGAGDVPWFRPVIQQPGNAGPSPPATGPPSSEDVARRFRKALDEHLADLRARGKEEKEGREGEKGVIWRF